MSLSTTTAAAVALFTLTAVAAVPPTTPEARAEVVRVGAGELRSVTELDDLHVEEAVTLDAEEHLVRAYVHVEQRGRVPTSTWLDRPTSTVTVARGTEVVRLAPPTDAPWAYEPPVATALGAWVVARAAATGGPVRIVRGGRSDLVPADQLLVSTSEGMVAIVGEAAADLDARFVAMVHLRERGTLVRSEASADRWVFAARRGNF